MSKLPQVESVEHDGDDEEGDDRNLEYLGLGSWRRGLLIESKYLKQAASERGLSLVKVARLSLLHVFG